MLFAKISMLMSSSCSENELGKEWTWHYLILITLITFPLSQISRHVLVRKAKEVEHIYSWLHSENSPFFQYQKQLLRLKLQLHLMCCLILTLFLSPVWHTLQCSVYADLYDMNCCLYKLLNCFIWYPKMGCWKCLQDLGGAGSSGRFSNYDLCMLCCPVLIPGLTQGTADWVWHKRLTEQCGLFSPLNNNFKNRNTEYSLPLSL